MDSRTETFKHIQVVQKHMNVVIKDLVDRSERHDQSKLNSPEVEIFDEYTEKLKASTYGSDEYKGFLKEMKIALDHHYHFPTNDHHPENHINGIKDMNLINLVECLLDWKSATERHADGDIYKSIEINQKRFGYGDELKNILINTAKYLKF